MTEPEFPPVTLKADDKVGLYFLCDEAGADDLRDCLKGDEVKFSVNPSAGAHLAEAGKVLFAFGKTHPRFVTEALKCIGEEVLIDPAVAMPEDAYPPPVKQLLSLGEAHREKKRDYVALGLSRDDAPALIRMATDYQLHDGPGNSPIVWAPIHAWRALAELRAPEAIAPLIELFPRVDDSMDDWVGEDVPRVLAEFGAATLAPLTAYLADATHGEWSRVIAAKSIGFVGKAHPDTRNECVIRLSHQLAFYPEQSETLNAFLILPLLDLRAVEAMPLIERAFAFGRVDETVFGDVEDVQIEFGLKTKREHPLKPNALTIMGEQLRAAWKAVGFPLPDIHGNFPELELESPVIDLPHQTSIAPPDSVRAIESTEPYIAPAKVGRNDPCPCGSGKKSKKCCGA